MTKAQKVQNEMSRLFKARYTCLWVQSPEELRAENGIIEAAAAAQYPVLLWDVATGLSQPPTEDNPSGLVVDAQLRDPMAVVGRIRESRTRAVYILRDLHRWLNDPMLTRLLRSTARELQDSPVPEQRTIVILSPSSEVPPDLKGQTALIEYPLPDREEMAAILNEIIEVQGLVDDDAPARLRQQLEDGDGWNKAVEAAMGLSGEEAANCYSKSLVVTDGIDVSQIVVEKKRLIRGAGLEWADPDPRGLGGIAGMDEVKRWATLCLPAFTAEGQAFGLTAPRGLILGGIPGCGKSLFAKCLATAWGCPLLSGDLGAAKSKWVGQSEANLRSMLSIATTIGRCVLFFDEIEKSLGGSNSAEADGGVVSDQLGYLLRWMQERTEPVFVIATANDLTKLPPELLRKGRFDELFFVDLPTEPERQGVLEITLEQYNRNPKAIGCDVIASATQDFSGAEVAALVPAAMFAAYAEGRDITTADLVKAAGETKPLARTTPEKIEGLRKWAQGRARRASAEAKPTARKGRAVI
jgi:hypothetical protein